MTIRTILVPLYGDGADAACLAAAADIAQAMAAHVTALFCESDPSELLQSVPGWEAGAISSMTLMKSLQERAEAQRKAADRSFSQWLTRSQARFATSPDGQHGATAELIVASGRPTSVIHDYAVVADLVITTIADRGELNRTGVLETTLFDSGRPVLAVPATTPAKMFAAPVAVAWNYSAEAARALNAALPIIEARRGGAGPAGRSSRGRGRRPAGGGLSGVARGQGVGHQARPARASRRTGRGQSARTGRRTAGDGRLFAHTRARVRVRRHDQVHAGERAGPAAVGALSARWPNRLAPRSVRSVQALSFAAR